MNKQQMIDFIYDKVSDKNLTFGCKVKLPTSVASGYSTIERINKCHKEADKKYMIYYTNPSSFRFVDKIDDIPIGHPVLIGDILDFYETYNPTTDDNGDCADNIKILLSEWKDKRKPIEEQSIECIEYIYNLLELGEK